MGTDCCFSSHRMFRTAFNSIFNLIGQSAKKGDPETSSSEDEDEDGPRKDNKLFKVASKNIIREQQKKKLEIQKKKIFSAAREIMTSEKTFVDILKLLNNDFR